MNCASFMEDYANFGLLGLIASSMLLAALLVALGSIFSGRRAIGVALNSAPILYLSSGALLSLLFSGGWICIVLLYMIFRRDFEYGLER